MRHDQTSWLIHFARDRSPEAELPDDVSEMEELPPLLLNGEIRDDAPSYYVLRTILRLGGLLPGYSFRSGRTTVYGGQPVVCASEMPIYSLAQYVKGRSDTRSVSAYGVAFLKSEFYAAGGRPAIYGLSEDSVTYKVNSNLHRILDESVLPIHEQYRYVAYNPSPRYWVDWSHEREWRWRVTGKGNESVCCMDTQGAIDSVPGLPLLGGIENNCHFTKIYVIVWTRNEAEEIQKLLTGVYLAKANDYDTPFSREVISKSKIIILEEVIEAVDKHNVLDAQTIEGIEAASLVSPVVIHSAGDEAATGRVKSALRLATHAAEQAAAEFAANHDINKGYCGYAHSCTYDVTNPLVQLMLNLRAACGPFDGKVVVYLRGSWQDSQSMDYHEAIYRAATQVLTKELGVAFYMEGEAD